MKISVKRQNSSSADRQRRYRARLRAGRAVYRVEVDDAAITDLLVASGFLPLTSADDHEKTRQALERLLASLVTADVLAA